MTAIETHRNGKWYRGMTFHSRASAAKVLKQLREQAIAAGVTIGRYRLRDLAKS